MIVFVLWSFFAVQASILVWTGWMIWRIEKQEFQTILKTYRRTT